MFGRFTGTGNMALLHSAPFPSDLISLGVEGISGIWRQMKLRGIGRKRAQRIYEAAQTSVGCTHRYGSSPYETADFVGGL